VRPAESLRTFLDESRARVDEALERFLPAPPACPPLIAEAMRYSVMAGGKRLRPILALAAADAIARQQRAADPVASTLPAACALELIHTYSLIHDDLPAMDDDTLRRGRPTLHVVYGEGVAILAGDGLQAAAFDLVSREPATADPIIVARKLRVVGVLAAAAGPSGMVGGQTIDLQGAGQAPGHALSLDAESLRSMHARKTGALITASAASGAIMAGADDDALERVSEYASQLGVAFQIIDDVLDVEGDAATLGKTAGKDAARAKPSYPALYGVARSRALAGECVDRARTALERGGLTDSWLGPIAEWIVRRTS
jgi:geranylgeranyl diphosphate synthase type II